MKRASIVMLLLCMGLVGIVVLSNVVGLRPFEDGFGGIASTASAAVEKNEPKTLEDSADAVLEKIGVSRGICVVLGDPDCELAVQLARQSELLIYVQLGRAKEVERACRAADAAGLYGTRIFIEKGAVKRLHLGDNLADALVAVGRASRIPQAEALRVLRPEGKALLGRKELIKPFPEGVDDWSHPYHGPDNNPQSRDQVARAPYLTQFLSGPLYAPLPQVAVASAGRVFKAFGHLAFKVREEALLNTLVAFNGYNGTMLWKRPLTPGIMIHRNTLIATPTTLYVGDDKSCKVIDAETGRLEDEIAPPPEVAGGTFWKWMALEDGVLYALVGEDEQRDPVVRQRRQAHGWPWDPLSKGYNQPNNPWGYGRTLLAINPKTKKVLWSHKETEPIDSRALCMKNGRIYGLSFGSFLTCLDAKTGNEVWRKTKENDPDLFKALGPYLNRQDWRTNWRTTSYIKCSDKAVYFAGPQVGELLAVSAEDGSVLWKDPYSNFQLILRDDELYGISGQIDKELSKRFDPLTGRVLAEMKVGRRACTRPTGAIDAIFFRASGGTTRLDVASGRSHLLSPMRAQCHDGVTIANGLIYWWPSVCDCNLTLYGITCLGPVEDFDFNQGGRDSDRLEKGRRYGAKLASLPESPEDWPTFRANNTGTVTTTAVIPEKSRRLWQFSPRTTSRPTPPTAVGGMVFLSGSDGIVRALNAATGKPQWKAFIGGGTRIPPTIWKGRALVGSGDGWVYALEAGTGRLLWRFRAAPAERRIPVYGALLSTWPAASGVLVEDGTAYVAAGIASYDGTHVYALDAATGKIKWQNNTSGHLGPEALSGVSVQGQLLLYGGKLCLAGGNAVSPAIYDIANGKCLNDPNMVKRIQNNNVPSAQSPRGWELYQIARGVVVSGKPFYAHPKYKVYDPSVLNKTLIASTGDRDIAWANNSKVMCFARVEANRNKRFLEGWGKPSIPGLKPLWEKNCKESVALAVCKNAVVVAMPSEIVALNLQDGGILWTQPLPSPPVPWGLAVDRDGRVVVTLEDGRVLCFG